MRAIFRLTAFLSIGLLSACQHFDPMDIARQDKTLNLAIINSETYALIPNAHCTIITDTQDNIETHLNPDAILLQANYQSLAIECRAQGYTQTAIAITNTINQWSASDVFMLPPGDIVDTTSSLLPYYPSHILVLMNKKPLVTEKTVEHLYHNATVENQLYQGTVA